MNATEELPRGQQLLLQRIFAKHCVSSDEAKRMFNSLTTKEKYEFGNQDEEEDDDDTRFMGTGISSVEDAFVSINRQLKPGFGLEIVTLVDSSASRSNNNTGSQFYHAVVNSTADEIAKKDTVFLKSWNPHERAFVRLVMRALVDRMDDEEGDEGAEDEKEEEDGGAVTAGIRRADLINLRSELDSGFKLSLDEATRVVGILLEEKWLRVSVEPDSKASRRSRESVQAKIELAPRTYMELDHYLTQIGLDAGKLPQILFHRD